MRDVASRAGVDTSVVSRLLSKDPKLSISLATRQRVVAAIEALEYRPNLAARALRTSRGGLVSFIVPQLTNQVYSAIISGANRKALQAGYSIVIGESSSDLAQTGREYRARGVDGVLLAGAMIDDDQIIRLYQTELPLVVVNRTIAGVADTVSLDYGAGCELAARHLLDLGHRRIVILTGPRGFDASTGRAAAFSASVRRMAKIRTRSMPSKGISGEDGTVAGHQLLDRYPDATAVFTTTLMLAVGLLRAAHERGIRVPDELSIVSMHDSEIAQYAWPPLTTVAMPMQDLGEQAFDRLVGLIEGKRAKAVTLRLPPTLMVRGSTAAPRPQSSR